jgi:hypothetical protein
LQWLHLVVFAVKEHFSESIQKQAEAVGSNSSEALATYAVDLADALIGALNK